MKIALVCPASLPATQFGGIMFLCIHIAKKLSNDGHNLTIYTTDLEILIFDFFVILVIVKKIKHNSMKIFIHLFFFILFQTSIDFNKLKPSFKVQRFL